jgi:hypothetical protein
MKVPASFVRVVFLSYPKGSGYTAGKEAPTAYFIAAARLAVGGSLIPVPGGVLVQDKQKRAIGAVGVTGRHARQRLGDRIRRPGGCESYLARSMGSGP